MTVNDICKCCNMTDNTRFVIHSDDGVIVYDGTWRDINEKLKEAEAFFFSIDKIDEENQPKAKEVFIALKELFTTLEV